MTDMAITPVQSQGITGQDVGIAAGATAVGALGGGAMYFKTPSEDAFVKAGIQYTKKGLKKIIKAALKEANGDFSNLSEATKAALSEMDITSFEQLKALENKSILKGVLETAKGEMEKGLKKGYAEVKEALTNKKTLDQEAKDILNKAKMNTAIKWGAIVGSTLLFLTACYLRITKDNNAESQQTQTVEKA